MFNEIRRENETMDMEQLLELHADLELRKELISLEAKKIAEKKARWDDNTGLFTALGGLACIVGMGTAFGYIAVPVATISTVMQCTGYSILGGVTSALIFDGTKKLALDKKPSTVKVKEKKFNTDFVETFAIKKK